MPYRETIANAYNAGTDEELKRLTDTPMGEAEFQLITGLLDTYIPDGSTVIDVGSGPGRYAEHLLRRSCRVGVVDLSAKSLKAFSDRLTGTCCRENILFNEVSCATLLHWIPDHSADAVLLMGPLYHLIDATHRNNALDNCRRILKPGGLLFAIFLSPFPVMNQPPPPIPGDDLQPTEKTHPHHPLGLTTYTPFQGFKVPQFRCWPMEAEQLLKEHGFNTLQFSNIEKIPSARPVQNTPLTVHSPESPYLNHPVDNGPSDETPLGLTPQYIFVGSLVSSPNKK